MTNTLAAGHVSSPSFPIGIGCSQENPNALDRTETEAHQNDRLSLETLGDPRDPQLITRLAKTIADESDADGIVAIVSQRGGTRHLGVSTLDKDVSAVAKQQRLRDIIREGWIAQRPLLAGFPKTELNSASWILNHAIQHGDCAAMAVLPIRFDGESGGAVIVLQWKEHQEIRCAAVHAVLDSQAELARILDQWRLCDIAKRWQVMLKAFQKIFAWRSKTVFWVVAVLFALLWLPWYYQPKREAILQPAIRSYVSSPIEGILKECLVRPGDRVQEGQVLARLDDRVIRGDLAMARAELEAAQKRADRALYQRAGGDLSVAQLECEQIQTKIQILEDKLDRLEIRCLADGTIVQGDWHGHEGTSLSLGQTLFEIAPLDSMTVEVQLLPTDLAWVQEGMRVKLHSETAAGRNWESRIERISPSAETIDQKLYFIAEFQVENDDAVLRPGMKGLVRIQSGFRTVGWILFRGPYRWLRHQWVW